MKRLILKAVRFFGYDMMQRGAIDALADERIEEWRAHFEKQSAGEIEEWRAHFEKQSAGEIEEWRAHSEKQSAAKIEEWRTHFKMRNPNFVFVYQMGKVGSTAICRSLDKVGYPNRHCQWLNESVIQRLLNQKNDVPGYLRLSVLSSGYRRLAFQLQNKDFARTVKVITGAREPVSYMLSAFFHGIENLKGLILHKYDEYSPDTIKQCLLSGCEWFLSHRHETLDAFLLNRRNYPSDLINFAYIARNPLHWFDEEVYRFFGVDVFREPFGTKGYCVYDNVLVIRFEDLARIGEEVISAFIQRPKFRLIEENIGANKSYADLYEEVRNTIRFPKSYLEYVYSSKYAEHFYTTEELNKFYQKWS